MAAKGMSILGMSTPADGRAPRTAAFARARGRSRASVGGVRASTCVCVCARTRARTPRPASRADWPGPAIATTGGEDPMRQASLTRRTEDRAILCYLRIAI